MSLPGKRLFMNAIAVSTRWFQSWTCKMGLPRKNFLSLVMSWCDDDGNYQEERFNSRQRCHTRSRSRDSWLTCVAAMTIWHLSVHISCPYSRKNYITAFVHRIPLYWTALLFRLYQLFIVILQSLTSKPWIKLLKPTIVCDWYAVWISSLVSLSAFCSSFKHWYSWTKSQLSNIHKDTMSLDEFPIAKYTVFPKTFDFLSLHSLSQASCCTL